MELDLTALKENGLVTFEQALARKVSEDEVKIWIRDHAQPYRELMAYYHCAIMEVETKFNVLNEDLALRYDRNPIETIKTRLKTPESILEKLMRNGYPLTSESIEENLSDVAGVRVICSFTSDIYMLAEALLQQDDVTLVEEKDYITNPKPSGYRSLHLIVSTPIFLHDKKKMMRVEVQFRTLAMDMWASLEHKTRYKKPPLSKELNSALYECSELSAILDKNMETIYRKSSEERKG